MGAERFADAIGNPSYVMADAIAFKSNLIDEMAKAKRDVVVASISPAEMASWPIKRAEALAFDGTDESAPNVALEAQARGISTAALVDKVLTKGQQLSWLEAQIAGACGRHQDAIRRLSDFDAVADYDYSIGWPEV